jgi:hypothetical protein
LLKLGIAISERTVSRYLRGRPTTRSQTWGTFFANHLGGQTFISPVMFADADDEDIVVDDSDLSFHRVPSIDASCASIHGPIVDWGCSLQPRPSECVLAKITFRTAQERARAAAVTRRGTCDCNQPRSGRRVAFVPADSASASDGRERSFARAHLAICSSDFNSASNRVVNVVGRPTLRSVRGLFAM